MDLTGSLQRLVRRFVGLPDDPGLPPRIDRLALYRATVTKVSSDGALLDVTPANGNISPEQGVQLLVGIPGATMIVKVGAVVRLGWESGDPAQPYCVPAWDLGGGVAELVFNADLVVLGAKAGADFIALAAKVLAELQKVQTHFTAVEAVLTGPPIAEAGSGAPSALQAALAIVIAGAPYPSPSSVAATLGKAK